MILETANTLWMDRKAKQTKREGIHKESEVNCSKVETGVRAIGSALLSKDARD